MTPAEKEADTRCDQQNRTRWFRLSGKSFAYFTKDAGELIGSVAVGEIESVKSVSKYQLCITTTVPFGKSNMLEMVLEAPSETVRERWESSLGMLQLQKMDGGPVAFGSDEDTLVAEGYLIKVQESLLALSRTRYYSEGLVTTTRRLTLLPFSFCTAGSASLVRDSHTLLRKGESSLPIARSTTSHTSALRTRQPSRSLQCSLSLKLELLPLSWPAETRLVH